MSALFSAQHDHVAAMEAFHVASTHLLHICTQQAGLEIALLHGLLPSDSIVAEIDRERAQASLQLWACRQALQAATEALAQAERDHAAEGQPSVFERQLAIVAQEAPALHARYEAAVQVDADADGDEAQRRARYILSLTRREIMAWKGRPQEVAS
jgi:hypothetical protein